MSNREGIGRDVATEAGRRAIEALSAAGKAAGLATQTEYPIPGGRIDLVWVWSGPAHFPVSLPLVGFEIESSWRTRKHIKGDLLNLQELQPALGVIVLLGEGEKVESTRRFAKDLVARHVGTFHIWDQNDVAKLGQEEPDSIAQTLGEIPIPLAPNVEATLRHAGKYRRLAEWLAARPSPLVHVTFSEIEEVLGFPLPPSSRDYVAHWHGYKGSAVARAIADAGWRARNVNLNSETLVFERLAPAPGS